MPLRFPLHVLQMTGLYVGQMAPSAFIINCANFQAADEMRRIQRLAYLTKLLANAHGDDIAATATARDPWEAGAAWQPLREVLERMLAVYDWGEAFVVLNLVVKPAIDALVNDSLAALAARNGDEFLALLLAEFQRDSASAARTGPRRWCSTRSTRTRRWPTSCGLGRRVAAAGRRRRRRPGASCSPRRRTPLDAGARRGGRGRRRGDVAAAAGL